MRFEAYGTTFDVRSTHQFALEDVLARAQTLGWIASDTGAVDVQYDLRLTASWELYCDGALVGSSSDFNPLLNAFENHAKLTTAYYAEKRLFVHAGAVSWKGRGIVIPGHSRAGKTSLVRALIALGAVYYSDEFAVFDSQGLLHPYALPLSVRRPRRGTAERIPIESLGGVSGTTPVRVALIVDTEYRRGARWRPRALTPGKTLLKLMTNTVAARRPPETTMPILRRVVLQAGAIESRRADAARVAASILATADALG